MNKLHLRVLLYGFLSLFSGLLHPQDSTKITRGKRPLLNFKEKNNRALRPDVKELSFDDECTVCLAPLRKDHEEISEKIEDLQSVTCSKIEHLDSSVCSKITQLETTVKDGNQTVCDKIIRINDDLIVHDLDIKAKFIQLCTKINDLEIDLSRVICSKIDKHDMDVIDNIADLRDLIEVHDMEVEDSHQLICSKIEEVDRDLEKHDKLICSKIANFDGDLEDHDERVCSKLENLSDNLEDHNSIVCSKLENLEQELSHHDELIRFKLEDLSEDLNEHDEEVTFKLENIENEIGEVQFLLSHHDELICSKLEELEMDLEDHDEKVCSKVDEINMDFDAVCSKIEDLGDDLDEHDQKICSKLENLDEDLFDHDQSICSKLEDLSDDLAEHDKSICSKLEIIDAKIDCGTIITQADIGNGDQFEISQPGVYCLVEPVTFSVGTAIRITSDNVVIDLQGYGIDGSSIAETGIKVNNAHNVIIKNGGIENITFAAIDIDPSSDIKIHDVVIRNSETYGIFVHCLSENIIIEDCTVTNAAVAAYKIAGSYRVIFRRCVAQQEDDGISGIGFNVGGSVVFEGLDKLEDPILTPISSSDCCFLKCKAHKLQGIGFLIESGEDAIVEIAPEGQAEQEAIPEVIPQDVLDEISNINFIFIQCISLNNQADGFNTSGNNTTFKCCVAVDNEGDGFDLRGLNGVLYDCVAQQNTSNGFDVADIASNTAIVRCSAINNNNTGFQVGADRCVIRHSLAQENGNNNVGGGFIFENPSSNCELRDSSAVGNIEFGMKDSNAGSTGLVVCNNTAHGTVSGDDLVGVPDSNLCKGQMTLCSKLEDLDDDLEQHNRIVCSKLEGLDADLESHNQSTCSKLGKLDIDLSTHDHLICSKLIHIDENLSLHDSTVNSKLSNLDVDLSIHDFLICSKLEDLDSDVQEGFSKTESQVDAVKELLCSKIDELDDCMPIQIDGQITINTAGIYCLTGDINFNAGNGITITADNVVLDLNGYTLNGNNTGIDGILLNGVSKIIIKNGFISDVNGDGIHIQNNSSLIMIHDITILDVASDGVEIESSSDVVLENCVVSGATIGFKASGTDRLTFERCIATGNSTRGFFLDTTSSSCLNNCKSQNNLTVGFEDSASCESNNYVDCVAQANTVDGFKFIGVHDSARNCTAQENTGNGFWVQGADCASALTNCMSIENTGAGYRVDGDEALLVHCYALRNGSTGSGNDGFYVNDANYVVMSDCISISNGAAGNGDGFRIGTSSLGVELINCSAKHNVENGINVEPNSEQVSIRNCKASSNGVDGINIDADNCEIVSNSAVGNTTFGIDDNGTGSIVFNNVAHNNGTDFDGVGVTLDSASVATTTGFWTNVRS